MRRTCACLGLLAWGLAVLPLAAQVSQFQKQVEQDIKTIKGSKNAEQRAAAVASLIELASVRAGLIKPAVPVLIDALKDPAGEVRLQAALAMAVIQPDPKLAAPGLAALLDDKEGRDTRLAAAAALLRLAAGASGQLVQIEAARNKEAGRDKKDDELLAALDRLYSTVVRNSLLKLGDWHVIGPFDHAGGAGFDIAYPPEKEIDLAKKYRGKNNNEIAWRKMEFNDGEVNSLAIFGDDEEAVCYLYREIECPKPIELPVSLGSDDTLTVWLNGQKLLSEKVYRGAEPDQNKLTLKLKAGKNAFLMKICQGGGDWAFYFLAGIPRAQ